MTSMLAATESALCSPVVGEDLQAFGRRSYDVFLRVEGKTDWVRGTTTKSANMAFACQTYVRRHTPHIAVKVLPHGISP